MKVQNLMKMVDRSSSARPPGKGKNQIVEKMDSRNWDLLCRSNVCGRMNGWSEKSAITWRTCQKFRILVDYGKTEMRWVRRLQDIKVITIASIVVKTDSQTDC